MKTIRQREDNMVVAENLSKYFGYLRAVNDISLTVARGEVLGFLGPNGSGKTTTMKMITGFLKPGTGRIKICGIDMLASPVSAQRLIGYLPEGAPAYVDITTVAYLNFIADVRKLTGKIKRQAIGYVVDRIGLGDVIHQPIGTLSKGYKRRVGLAQALLHNPDVLVLDEPTDGLDPNQKHEVRSLIRETSAKKGIIISTHNLEEVEAVCDRILVITDGRLVANDTPKEFIRRSPHHNAVVLTLPSSNAESVCTELKMLTNVSDVEIKEVGNGNLDLVVLANEGYEILPAVVYESRRREWPIQKIRIEQGRLDEIFRDITKAGVAKEKEAAPVCEQVRNETKNTTWFNDTWVICKNELIGYFATPIAYVFIVIFLVTIGSFTFFLNEFFARGEATLDGFFQFHPWLYLLFIPAISMRLWAEERKSGSIEILLTLPVTTLSAVLGKFFAAWAIVGLSLLLTTPVWFTVNYLGSPDNGVIMAGYFGSLLMAGGYLSIGAFISAMTKNQIIAFVITAALCFAFTASGLSVVLEFFSGWAPISVLAIVADFSFLENFRNISRGVVGLREVAFFGSTIIFFLFANAVAVEHWKNA